MIGLDHSRFPQWPHRHTSSTRPVIWLNCAMSLDGKLAYSGGRRAVFSGHDDLARVQRLRATSDAVMVGAGTVRLDDPSLRIHWELLEGEMLPPEAAKRKTSPPLRVALGSPKGLPSRARFLDGSLPTVVFSVTGDRTNYPHHVIVVPTDGGEVDLTRPLEWLKKNGVERLMVEGGSRLITSFLRAGMVDRVTLLIAPVLVGGQRAPALFAGPESHGSAETVNLHLVETDKIDDGILLTLVP